MGLLFLFPTQAERQCRAPASKPIYAEQVALKVKGVHGETLATHSHTTNAVWKISSFICMRHQRATCPSNGAGSAYMLGPTCLYNTSMLLSIIYVVYSVPALPSTLYPWNFSRAVWGQCLVGVNPPRTLRRCRRVWKAVRLVAAVHRRVGSVPGSAVFFYTFFIFSSEWYVT